MSSNRGLLDGLNSEQVAAVTHIQGPLKIVAGAGTGKTGTLTARFAYLVERGIPADRILALTFSRRAAVEFRDRTLRLLDTSYKRLWISTFHTFCLRVLVEEKDLVGSFGIMGEPEQKRTIARAVRDDPEAAGRHYYVGESGAARLVADALTLISRTKDEGITAVDFVEYADRRDVERLRELANVYFVYTELCRRRSRLDFGDLGSLLVEALRTDGALLERWRSRFDHVMVDEFQDTNESQWQLLTLLAPPPDGNLTVVGDGCQAIYAFRGASSRFFNQFTDEYTHAHSVVLSTNYRSRQHILDVAHALICSNTGHEIHRLRSSDEHAGEPVRMAGFVDEDAEADYVARSILKLVTDGGLSPNDCAVLCRSVKQEARPLARAFNAYGIPFRVRGYDPTVEEAFDDLSAVLRCIGGEATWSDASRVLVRRQVALRRFDAGLPEDALARRYAHLLGPNQELLQAVPPLDSISYAGVTNWLEGSESWRTLDEVRRGLPARLAIAAKAIDRLVTACAWLRTQPLEAQVYAALALVGRLNAGSPASPDARAGVSACRQALRTAHGLSRAGLGIPDLLRELRTLVEEGAEMGEAQEGNGVTVLTLHAAKGLEWPAVFIVGMAAGLLPAPLRLDRAFDLDDLARYVRSGRRTQLAELAARYEEEPERQRAIRFAEEEWRLAYVGCTRARERLVVTFARSYGRRETLPSPFIAELQRADSAAWMLDGDTRAGVMLPLDVARSVRQQALAALGVSGRKLLPAANLDDAVGGQVSGKVESPLRDSTHAAAGGVLSSVLAAQWTSSQVPGGVPIRFRDLPRPFGDEAGVVGSLPFSFTAIESYRACPRQFFYGYVLHVDAPAGGASATLGTKIHNALRDLNTSWMNTGRLPTDDEVQEVWRAGWKIDGKTIDAALANPETRVPWEPGFSFARQTVQAWKRGGGMLRRYYTWERDLRSKGMERVPVAVEKAFRFPHGDHILEGRIDCVFRGPAGDTIVDYKSGKPSSDLKAAKSLQLAMYEQAVMRDTAAMQPSAVAYYFLAHDSDRPGNMQPWDSSRQVDAARYSETARQELWDTIDEVLVRVMRNDFAAQPAKRKETCGRCPYNGWCEESLA